MHVAVANAIVEHAHGIALLLLQQLLLHVILMHVRLQQIVRVQTVQRVLLVLVQCVFESLPICCASNALNPTADQTNC